MLDIRVRSKLPQAAVDEMLGKILTDNEYSLLLTDRATVRKPDGSLLCVYLPGVIPEAVMDATYPTLHGLRKFQTDNRGYAAGSPRIRRHMGKRTRSKKVRSTIVGSYDGRFAPRYCRLTAWTGEDLDRYQALWPLFQVVGGQFASHVPDRYAAQMAAVRQTPPEWIIRDTPFSTITINNSYSTGVHQDAGDLKEGFGNLAVLRYGTYSGGYLVFPAYRVAVDMQHGDVLLMDVHESHGNTALELESEDAERISIVAYMRAGMTKCGSAAEEAAKAVSWDHQNAGRRMGTGGPAGGPV